MDSQTLSDVLSALRGHSILDFLRAFLSSPFYTGNIHAKHAFMTDCPHILLILFNNVDTRNIAMEHNVKSFTEILTAEIA